IDLLGSAERDAALPHRESSEPRRVGSERCLPEDVEGDVRLLAGEGDLDLVAAEVGRHAVPDRFVEARELLEALDALEDRGRLRHELSLSRLAKSEQLAERAVSTPTLAQAGHHPVAEFSRAAVSPKQVITR